MSQEEADNSNQKWDKIRKLLIEENLSAKELQRLKTEMLNTMTFEREMIQQALTDQELLSGEQFSGISTRLDALEQRLKEMEDWKNLYNRQLIRVEQLITKIDAIIDKDPHDVVSGRNQKK